MAATASDQSVENDVSIINPDGRSPVLLVCEHASPNIPDSLGGLGLSETARLSHVDWDPGAYDVALKLSALLDAQLVASEISRLVYDCNRPPEATGAMPESSEIHEIPGNKGLSAEERSARTRSYYRPFEVVVDDALSGIGGGAMLVTIHSFTPVYFGEPRDVELGILHDHDTRLADAMLLHASENTSLLTQRNEPYSASDGVTHTLKRHGIQNGIPNVMLEIRNDLIATPQDVLAISTMLSVLIATAVDHCRLAVAQGSATA